MNFSKALGGLSGQLPNHEYYILENLGGHLFNLGEINWYKELIAAKDRITGQVNTNYTQSRLSAVKSQLDKVDKIIIVTDNDPSGEGDVLAWEVLEYIGIDKKPVYRLVFDDETPTSINKSHKQASKAF